MRNFKFRNNHTNKKIPKNSYIKRVTIIVRGMQIKIIVLKIIKNRIRPILARINSKIR